MYLKKMSRLFLISFLLIGCNNQLFGKNLFWFKKEPVAQKPKLPLFYHTSYNISFFGIEKLHPFDSHKYGRIVDMLQKKLSVTSQDFYKPNYQVTDQNLKKVHTQSYLNSLKDSKNVEYVTELIGLRYVPNFLLRWRLLKPMRYATQGTIEAAQFALQSGVAINLSGGYHHAQPNQGGGFCAYADIPLAIKILREKNPDLKVMYIDLDAHQGNGVEACLVDDENSYIFDCFNECNYPGDSTNAQRINKKLLIDRKSVV